MYELTKTGEQQILITATGQFCVLSFTAPYLSDRSVLKLQFYNTDIFLKVPFFHSVVNSHPLKTMHDVGALHAPSQVFLMYQSGGLLSSASRI